MGHILASEMRMPPRMTVGRDVEERGALQSAIRNSVIPSWAKQFGEIYYNATRHEKITGATIRMSKEHFMIVAFDASESAFDRIIMEKILPMVRRKNTAEA